MSFLDLGSATLYDLVSVRLAVLAAVTLAAVAIATRYQSGSSNISKLKGGHVIEAARVPYWLPIVGHIPNMIWDATHFLRSLRDRYTDGAFSLNFGGTAHTIIYTPALVTALLNTKDSKASHEEVSDRFGTRIFGFPMASESEKYHAATPEIRACFHHLLNEKELNRMTTRTAQATKETISNLVSYMKSPVDQTYWERTAAAELTQDQNGKEVVAADLVHLIRDYCAMASNPSVIGSDFLENYPNFLPDLWAVDRGFLYLGAGLPRITPIPLVTRAHIARRRLINAFADFEKAMDLHTAGLDPGPRWRNLDDVGTVVKERIHVYRKHNLSMKARAAFEFGLLWATNANSNMLVFWMLNRIYSDKQLLARIRTEIAPFVQAVQPEKILAVAEPPQIQQFDIEGLCSKCPILKSCYIECLRLDAGTWSFKVVKEDFELSSRDKSSKAFAMRKGDFIHAAHDLHNSDPACFPQPEVFQADRHIKTDETGKHTAELGTIRPYGGGSSMCKGRFFAFKECMIFAAAILAMWEMEPVGGGDWKMPRPRKATGVYSTSDRTRVWIRRRQLPVTA